MVKPKFLNLLPASSGAKKSTSGFPGQGLLLILLMLILLPAAYYGVQQIVLVGKLRWEVAESKRKTHDAKLKLSQAQSQLLQLEKDKVALLTEEENLKKKQSLLVSTMSEGKSFSGALAAFAAQVPENVWLTQLALSKEEVVLSGTTYEAQMITQFMNDLNSSGKFSNSRFTSSEKQLLEAQSVQTFSMTTQPVWE